MVCLRLGRVPLRILVQIITGHCLLEKHLFNIEVGTDPICPLCEQEDEDRDHFVLKCEALVYARLEVFGMPFLQPEDIFTCLLALSPQIQFENEEVPKE
jgi:hypothetical protein